MHRPEVCSSCQNRNHMSAVTCWGRGGYSQGGTLILWIRCRVRTEQIWFQNGLRWRVQAVWSDWVCAPAKDLEVAATALSLPAFVVHFANFADPSAELFRNPASELAFFLCKMGIMGFLSSLAFIGLRSFGLCAAGTAEDLRHTQHQWCPSFSSVSPPLLIVSRASASSSGYRLSIFCCETYLHSLCG